MATQHLIPCHDTWRGPGGVRTERGGSLLRFIRPTERLQQVLGSGRIADRPGPRHLGRSTAGAPTMPVTTISLAFHPDGTMRPGAGRWTVVAVRARARALATRANQELTSQPICKRPVPAAWGQINCLAGRQRCVWSHARGSGRGRLTASPQGDDDSLRRRSIWHEGPAKEL